MRWWTGSGHHFQASPSQSPWILGTCPADNLNSRRSIPTCLQKDLRPVHQAQLNCMPGSQRQSCGEELVSCCFSKNKKPRGPPWTPRKGVLQRTQEIQNCLLVNLAEMVESFNHSVGF